MANTDLRYRRTERNLLQAFGAALRTRPLEKISVTSLAAAADINKATFYLHYRDIYDLAEAYVQNLAQAQVAAMDYLPDYFNNPRQFAALLVDDFEATKEDAIILGRNHLMHLYLDAFAGALHARLNELRPVPDSKHGTMMTTFIINGILSLLPRYGDDTRAVAEVTGDALEALDEYARTHFDQ